MKKNLFRQISMALALGSAVLFGTQAEAVCGVTGVASSGQTTINYDPFNPTALSVATVSMAITRLNDTGGNRTTQVNLFLNANDATANGTSIIPTSVSGAAGSTTGVFTSGANIFYNFGTQPTLPSNGVTGSGNFLTIDYGNNSANGDTAIVVFQVQLPSNLNIATTAALSFNIGYTCQYGTGVNRTWNSGTASNALVFPIHVLSALQASYVGTALDFGEVGGVTTTQVLAAPATYTKSGNVRVSSSGPYSVSIASTPQLYRLTYAGGNVNTGTQALNYKVTFLGQTVSNTQQTFNTVTCVRAGVSASPGTPSNLLAVTATLLEGGLGPSAKVPSTSYADTLTVTVTPLVSTGGQQNCPSL